MKKWISKLLALTRRPDLPADHTWSPESIERQRTRGRFLAAYKESTAYREGFQEGLYYGAANCADRVRHEWRVLHAAGLNGQADVAKDLADELDAVVRRYEPRKGS